MNEIKRLSELDESQMDQAIEVFIEGFFFTLSSVSKDKDKLHRLFKSSLDHDMTYAYLQDGVAIGFLGLADHQTRPVKFDRDTYTQLLGKSSYKTVSAAFETVKDIGPQDIFIDYIATSSQHRSKGIGTQLIHFIHDTLGYKYIQLETFSKNTKAIALYERLGFETVKVNKSLMMKLSGYGNLVTMRLEVE